MIYLVGFAIWLLPAAAFIVIGCRRWIFRQRYDLRAAELDRYQESQQ